MQAGSDAGTIGAARSVLSRNTQGEPVGPLGLLTAVYFFDEFDTAAFSTLAPDIQRSFELTDERFIGLVVLNLSIVILLAVPLGYLADRVSRVRLVVLSGILAGSFSLATGLATSLAFLAVARFGNGLGLLANGAVHKSLLTDYYTPAARPAAFAFHTNALFIGAIVGPGVAGLAGAAFGWRAAFFVLFIPILLSTVVTAVRLKDPVRGGTDAPDAPPAPPPLPFWAACKEIWAIQTLRRLFIATTVLGAGIIPLAATLPLFLERTFGLGAFERGLIGAVQAFFAYRGVRRAGASTLGWFARGAHVPLRMVGMAFAATGPAIGLLAASTWLPLTIAVGILSSYLVGFLYAPLAAVQALVSPPAERSLAFSLGAISLVVGVAIYFAVGLGAVSDDHGIRWGVAILAPSFVAGGAVIASAGRFVAADLARRSG